MNYNRQSPYNNQAINNNQNSQEMKELITYIKEGIKDINDLKKIFGENGLIQRFSERDNKSNNQMRKFYSEIVEIYQEISSSSTQTLNKDKINTKLAMIEPRAYYSKQRNNITNDFFNFIKEGIETIIITSDNNEWVEKIIRFKMVYEAIIAYSTKG